MPDYRLRIGMTFKQQGRIFLIERCLPDGTLAVKDLLSGEKSGITQGELVNALFERKLELLGDENWSANLATHLDKVRVGDLSELADEDPLRMEAIRRYRYVERIRSEAPIGAGQEEWRSIKGRPAEQVVFFTRYPRSPPAGLECRVRNNVTRVDRIFLGRSHSWLSDSREFTVALGS